MTDRVKDIISKVMADLSSDQKTPQNKILDSWSRICEKKATQHTDVRQLQEGVVHINVDSPAWLFEMRLHKRRYLKLLQKDIPEVKDIRFKIGKVK